LDKSPSPARSSLVYAVMFLFLVLCSSLAPNKSGQHGNKFSFFPELFDNFPLHCEWTSAWLESKCSGVVQILASESPRFCFRCCMLL